MERKGAASLIGPQHVLVTGNWQLHRKKKKISHLRKHTHPPHGDTHTVQIIMMFG